MPRGLKLHRALRVGGVVIGALLQPVLVPEASSSDLLSMCTQRYAAWVSTCDATLRAKPTSGVAQANTGEWCSPTPQAVSELKTRLFAIDHTCASLTPDEKMRVAALIGQTLRMLGRVSACPTPTAPISTAAVIAADARPPKVIKPQAAAVSPAPPVSPPAMKARPLETPKATATVPPPSDTARVQVAAVPPRPQRQAVAETAVVPEIGMGGSSSKATAPKPPARIPASEPAPTLRTAEVRETGTVPIRTQAKVPNSETRVIARPETEPVMSEGECLFVRQTQPGSYVIDTSRCGSRRVEAAVEFYQANGTFSCVRQTVERDLAIVGVEARTPEINFQCIAGSAGCSAELLEQMFPECRNG